MIQQQRAANASPNATHALVLFAAQVFGLNLVHVWHFLKYLQPPGAFFELVHIQVLPSQRLRQVLEDIPLLYLSIGQQNIWPVRLRASSDC